MTNKYVSRIAATAIASQSTFLTFIAETSLIRDFTPAIESSKAHVIEHRQQDSRDDKNRASYFHNQPEPRDARD